MKRKKKKEKTPLLTSSTHGLKSASNMKSIPNSSQSPRAVRVLAAPPPGVLEVAVGGVGAGQEHVRGDVAEIGPELVEGLRVA